METGKNKKSLPKNIQIIDARAISLIVEKAEREDRTWAKTAARTVIEALGSKPDNLMLNGTENGKNEQA